MSKLSGATAAIEREKFVFVHHDGGQGKNARITPAPAATRNQTKIRAQAARASASIRLETSRRRAETRARRDGQGVFSLRPAAGRRNRITSGDNAQAAESNYDRRASATLRNNILTLGGTTPMAQVEVAALGHFMRRFNPGTNAERPWIMVVATENTAPGAPSLAAVALEANVLALCANDLRCPEISKEATKRYLSALTQLRALLKTPRWSDPDVLYTSMIMTLYECIQLNDRDANMAHVRGVSQLIRQRGPERFVRGLEHRVFRYYRINVLMVALFDRQHTFLGESEWITIPFEEDVPPKSLTDLLIDIMLALPGILGAIESLMESDLGPLALMQQAARLAYGVRRLVLDLEKWKVDHLWTYPSIDTVPNLRDLSLLALTEICTSQSPYDPKLIEALSCFSAAHLILGRIAWGLSQRSFIFGFVLPTPYSLHDLMRAINAASRRHIVANVTGMINLIVTTFALKAVETTTEVKDNALTDEARSLGGEVDAAFARRFNINYTPWSAGEMTSGR